MSHTYTPPHTHWRQIKAKPVTADDARHLAGFIRHLAGGRLPLAPDGTVCTATGGTVGPDKVAIVRWGPIELYLTLRAPEDPRPSHGLILHA